MTVPILCLVSRVLNLITSSFCGCNSMNKMYYSEHFKCIPPPLLAEEKSFLEEPMLVLNFLTYISQGWKKIAIIYKLTLG